MEDTSQPGAIPTGTCSRDALGFFRREFRLFGVEGLLIRRQRALLRLDGLQLGDSVRFGFTKLSESKHAVLSAAGDETIPIRRAYAHLGYIPLERLLQLLPTGTCACASARLVALSCRRRRPRLGRLVPFPRDLLLEPDKAVPFLLQRIEFARHELEQELGAFGAERVGESGPAAAAAAAARAGPRRGSARSGRSGEKSVESGELREVRLERVGAVR